MHVIIWYPQSLQNPPGKKTHMMFIFLVTFLTMIILFLWNFCVIISGKKTQGRPLKEELQLVSCPFIFLGYLVVIIWCFFLLVSFFNYNMRKSNIVHAGLDYVNLFSVDPRFCLLRFFPPNKFALASIAYSKSFLDERRKDNGCYFSSISLDDMF